MAAHETKSTDVRPTRLVPAIRMRGPQASAEPSGARRA